MNLKIENKQLDNIATWMKPFKETNLPSVLKGVFFMDGNPLPDDCITMYNLEWDAENNTLSLPVFGQIQWTFHNSILGRLLLIGAWLSQFTYKIQFEDETLQKSQIIPLSLGIPIPKWIINATMCQDESSQNGDIWQRKNIWFGIIPLIGDYTLRRIVDENGNYTSAFNDMLAKVENECLVVGRNSTEENVAVEYESAASN
ncbi:hypothetical protein Riv7116_6079 [Rivularia sp. PCC 7116]|uniref:hypothetical protein n=1 Tax=Rivularia sp. PCC 7116 TaxID=373994 RepID=UPI00029EC76A|nr:hypothetical protein [Rivularia sp. PCC 7116]AFY58435.1 hypothetical protein Riv7116_6079 [Rivularia sp. PCC 7116]